MSNVNDIIYSIHRIERVEDLEKIHAVIKSQWGYLQKRATRGLVKGDRVTWNSEKRGLTGLTGRIEKISTLSLKIVGDDGQVWRVSPSLVSLVD